MITDQKDEVLRTLLSPPILTEQGETTKIPVNQDTCGDEISQCQKMHQYLPDLNLNVKAKSF